MWRIELEHNGIKFFVNVLEPIAGYSGYLRHSMKTSYFDDLSEALAFVDEQTKRLHIKPRS